MTAEQPRTTAGRELVSRMAILSRAQHESVEEFTKDILAIEAEAARPLPEPRPQLRDLSEKVGARHWDVDWDSPNLILRSDRPEPSLNVERLADALTIFDRMWPVGQQHKAHFHEVPEDVFAEQIAAEYQRLSQPPDPATAHEVK